jgi:hypothetical protein
MSSAADRKRRQREREQCGIRWVLSIPVRDDVLDRLVDLGRLSEAEAETDRRKAARAVAEFLDDWAAPKI